MKFEKIRDLSSEIDDFALKFIDALCEENMRWQERSGCAVTLSGLFFHEAVKLVTSAYFRHLEIKSDAMLKLPEADSVAFPYVTYESFTAHQSTSHRKFALKPKPVRPLARVLFACINRVIGILRPHSCTVAVLDFQASKTKTLLRLFLSGYKLNIEKFPQQCYVPNSEEQYESLAELCNRALSVIPGLSDEIVEERLRPLVSHYVTKEKVNVFDRLLLVGSLSKINNRVVAANFCNNHRHVVTVHHGYAGWLGVLNEPIFGYGESSFCTAIVQPGMVEANALPSSENITRVLMPEQPAVFGADTVEIRKIVSSSSECIPTLDQLEKPRAMYVPTLYSGFEAYAPFRGLLDDIYLEWQQSLISNLAGKFEITVKLHPKGVSVLPSAKVKVEKEPFQKCYVNGDIYIFDYISSAFNIAAATDRPIIFFDLKVRKLHPKALAAVKERCIYISIEDLFQQTMNDLIDLQGSKKCKNTYTSTYCLNSSGISLEQQIADTVIGFL